ncbi:MAG: purine-binding chemotaxis protein CheW [Chloroflexi bacterium]|nr:purine-binding chemotaxis protein CheW [Chloroflexota bacterium]
MSEPRNGDSAAGTDGTLTRPMVHLDEFLNQVRERLMAAGGVHLAHSQASSEPPGERLHVVVFVLGGVRYAVEIHFVNEVLRQPDITPVPNLPAWVLGVINLHGEIVSTVDLAAFLALEQTTPAQRTPEMLFVAQAADQKIGLMVDSIEQIFTVPAEQVVSPPFKIEPNLVPYLRGAFDRDEQFVRLIDCERLLLGPQMQQFS